MEEGKLTLPDHIILEKILPRVPAKSLLRFKCVCKQWLLFISSPKFAEFCHSHLTLSSFKEGFLYMVWESVENPIHIRPHSSYFAIESDGCIQFQDNIFNLAHEHLRHCSNFTTASCNGIVCLRFFDLQNQGLFCLWNPTTRQLRYLPNPGPGPGPYDGQGQLLRSKINGFAYVPSIDDYRILALFESESYENNLSVYIFSLRAGVWRRIPCSYEHRIRMQQSAFPRPVVVGNRIYWGIKHGECGVRSLKFESILGFDLVSEQFIEITIPNMVNNRFDADEYDRMQLCEMERCLSLRCWKGKCSVVWMLKLSSNNLCECDDYSWEKADDYLNEKPIRQQDHPPLKDLDEYLHQSGSKRPLFCQVIEEPIDYVENLVSPFGISKFEDNIETFE